MNAKKQTATDTVRKRAVALLSLLKRESKSYIRWAPFVALFGLLLVPVVTTRSGYNMIYPSQLAWVAVFFVATALMVALVYHVAIRANQAARLLAAIATTYILLMDFEERFTAALPLLRAVLPQSSPHHALQSVLFIVVTFVVVGLLALWLSRIIAKKVKLHTQYLAVVVAISGMAAVSLLQNMPVFSQWNRSLNIEPEQLTAEVIDPVPSEEKPDIYYLVFDRYASDQSLRNNFDFNNSELTSFLEGQGFVVRDEAYSNYPYTTPSVSSVLRMDYHTDIPTDHEYRNLPYRKIFEDSPVSNFLREQDYETVRLGSWWELSRKEPGSRNINPHHEMSIAGKRGIISELHTKALERSYLSRPLKANITVGPFTLASMNTGNAADIFHTQMSALKQLAQEDNERPQFVFAHVLVPHPPYIFNEDGTITTYDREDNNHGAPRSVKYINQLVYLNTHIQDVITTIRENKRDAVIIIQSDEGPYPLDEDYGSDGKTGWHDAPHNVLEIKFGIQAAYYMPGVQEAPAQQLGSPVNSFRFVLNNYLGTNLPYLPHCSLIQDSDTPTGYFDITARLTGAEADDFCKEVGQGTE